MPFILQALPILLLPVLFVVGYFTAAHVPVVHYPASPLRFKVRQRARTLNGFSAGHGGDMKHANGNGTAKKDKAEMMDIQTFLRSRAPRYAALTASPHPRSFTLFANVRKLV